MRKLFFQSSLRYHYSFVLGARSGVGPHGPLDDYEQLKAFEKPRGDTSKSSSDPLSSMR
jgi:hypothetical protein